MLIRNLYSMNFSSKKSNSHSWIVITNNKNINNHSFIKARKWQCGFKILNFVIFHSPQWKLSQSVTQEQFGHSISGLFFWVLLSWWFIQWKNLKDYQLLFLISEVKYHLWRLKPNGGWLEFLTSIYEIYRFAKNIIGITIVYGKTFSWLCLQIARSIELE